MHERYVQLILVDDDLDDQEIFAEAVRRLGPNVSPTFFLSAREFFKWFDVIECCPEYIFLDINMPVHDGFECLQLIRNSSKFNNCKVVMYSTSSAPSDIRKAFDIGANLFFQKPTSLYDLTNSLRALIFDEENKNSIRRFIQFPDGF